MPIVNEKDSSPAKQRWKMLARSLRKSNICRSFEEGPREDNELSVRRFKGFNILSYEERGEDNDGRWYCIRNRSLIRNENMRIRYGSCFSSFISIGSKE